MVDLFFSLFAIPAHEYTSTTTLSGRKLGDDIMRNTVVVES
ncbi:hypothetical protein [Mesorhizobium japonicum]